MATYFWLKLSLTFHIASFVVAAGMVTMNFIVVRSVLQNNFSDDVRMNFTKLSALSSRVGMGAMIVLLLSGVSMMSLTKGVFMHVLWFQLKLGVLVLIIINGMVVGRILRKRMARWQSQTVASDCAVLGKWWTVSNVAQLIFFLAVFALASFRIA